MQKVTAKSKRGCNKSADLFCYICGLYTPKNYSRPISKGLEEAYHMRFKVPVQDQTKIWAPHVSCERCYNALLMNNSLPFRYPMVWFEPDGHHNCYFCMCNIKGYTVKTRNLVKYPSVTSVKLPSSECISPHTEEHLSEVSSSNSELCSNDDVKFKESHSCKISQTQLDMLVKEFNLSKENSQKMGRMLRTFKVLDSQAKYSHYRDRDLNYSIFFKMDDSAVFCSDILGILNELLFDSNINNWWLFMDSSKASLKLVMLHKMSKHPAIPIFYARKMKESYEAVKKALQLVRYEDLRLPICGDLKMVAFLMGLQKGYIKNMCFLCLWDSRDKSNQYTHEHWPMRKDLTPGKNNVHHKPLINPQNILLPPLHIKLGLFKQFVKSLKSPEALKFLAQLFPNITEAKITEGIFIGPQLRKWIKRKQSFEVLLNEDELKAWQAMLLVVQNFLGKNRSPNFKDLIKDMLSSFDLQKVRMSLKLHFLHQHLDFFHDDFGHINDEHGERFHQTMLVIEKRYNGRSDPRMMGDFCWFLKKTP